MPTLSQVKVGQTTYDICDAEAREKILKLYETSVTGNSLTVHFKRLGSLVNIYQLGSVTPSTANNWITIGTVTSGFRPKDTLGFSGIARQGTSIANSRTFLYSLNSAGEINFVAASTAAQTPLINSCFFTEENLPNLTPKILSY